MSKRLTKSMALSALLLLAGGAWAQLDTTGLVEGVGVDQKLGDRVELTLSFEDSQGNTVLLRDLLRGDVPVLFAPVYYNCPSLCSLTLNTVTDGINELEANGLRLGEDFRVLHVSINPDDTPETARAKKANYVTGLNNSGDGARDWHFLSGKQPEITKLMDQIGFRYKKVGEEYSHASAVVLLSPRGTITRYFLGMKLPGEELKRALVDASQGKVGSAIDKIYNFCFRYDPLAGKYTADAQNLMRAGGLLTIVAMAIGGFLLWKRELLNRRRVEQDV